MLLLSSPCGSSAYHVAYQLTMWLISSSMFALKELNAVGLHPGPATEVKILPCDQINGLSATCIKMGGIFVLIYIDGNQDSFMLGASLEYTLPVGENEGSEISVIKCLG